MQDCTKHVFTLLVVEMVKPRITLNLEASIESDRGQIWSDSKKNMKEFQTFGKESCPVAKTQCSNWIGL